jgi:Flp pilus assembly protein TadD
MSIDSARTASEIPMPERARELSTAAARALQGQAGQAEQLLQAALAEAPEHPELLRLMALAQRMQGKNAPALGYIRRAAAHCPNDALIQNGLGTALDAVGDREGALVAFRRACELAPQTGQLWANLGKSLSDTGRHEEALPILERAAQMTQHSATHLRLAYALRVLGHTDEAARRYRELIARDPADATAWLGLATLKTKPLAAADLAAMQEVLRTAVLGAEQRISLGFAVAKALDDHGQFAQAFEMLAQANAQARNARQWNAAGFGELTDAVLSAFSKPAASAPNGQGEEIIFIISMPRAGSSLTEQILASHSQVEGGGELEAMTAVITAESERRGLPFPFWTASTSALDWQRLGQQYLQRTAFLRRAGKRLTDKLPGNWLRVGAIMAMLPGARVIDCRRDPVESCFSCFRTLFTEGTQPFSYDLADLAAYWRDYDRTCRHWQALYPQRFRAQGYEQLVAEPQAQIAALLEFCGLPFEDACLRFHETRRSVRTASASQVREPLMRNTARAGKYGVLLNPLREALANAAKTQGS